MKSPTVSTAVESDHQELYVRTRDDPFFAGMRRDEIANMKKGSAIGLHEKLARKNKFRSASDIGTRGSRNISINISEEDSLSPKDSPFDIVLTPNGRSLTGKWSKTSSPLVVVQSDLNANFHDLNEPSTVCSPDSEEEKEGQGGFMSPTIQSSRYANTRQMDISDIPLPPSAALFYNGASQQMEVTQSCEGVYKLNMYLKASRAVVNAGVPGKFLHAVIGTDVADVGSVASTIMYSLFLYDTLKSKQFCTVPVINMKRADLDSHADVHWLLDSCHIDLSSLIFIDEIDLSYYNLFGCLKLVLINCDKIPSEQEALREAIVEVFHCTKSDIFSRVDNITLRQDVSCCTVIAEKIANGTPEILAGQGFSRLLLAGILMDSGNLSSSYCTSKDNYMATLLINGAGRFGFGGLHQILKYKTSSSNLKVKDILQKEFKKWTISGIGMSSIGMSIAQLLSHDFASVQEITHFQKLEALGLLLVVSGYYDSRKKFKREILISAESSELMKNLLLFLDSSERHQLPLKVLYQSGLKDEMRVFEVDKVASRRTIELLLEDYISSSNSSSSSL